MKKTTLLVIYEDNLVKQIKKKNGCLLREL